jgi:hypothetical protein
VSLLTCKCLSPRPAFTHTRGIVQELAWDSPEGTKTIEGQGTGFEFSPPEANILGRTFNPWSCAVLACEGNALV